MRTLKILWLMIVCFYYAVLTPGSVDKHRGEEQLLWGALSVSVFQGLIAMGLFHFFDWPSKLLGFGVSSNSELVGMFVFGGLAGTWTFVGAIMHPSLEEMLETNAELSRMEATSRELDLKAFEERKRSEDEVAFKKLVKNNPREALKEVLKAEKLLRKGKSKKIKYSNLKCSFTVYNEKNRLESII